MLDLKFVRENPEVVKQNIRNKFQDEKLPLVDEVIELDAQRRATQQEADALSAEKNKISKQIGALMAQGKKDEAENVKKKVAEDAARLEELSVKEKELDVTFERGADFDMLMENMGRVNFGPRMEHQRKGIGQCVQINGHMHNRWRQYTLPLDNIEKVDFSKEYKEGLPGFYRFTVDIDETADTFLDFEGWGKGCVFVNGFNIGRFWEIGPQKRLYIPAPLLKQGKNENFDFETEGKATGSIALMDEPDIG